jgi:hypothetical protein
VEIGISVQICVACFRRVVLACVMCGRRRRLVIACMRCVHGSHDGCLDTRDPMLSLTSWCDSSLVLCKYGCKHGCKYGRIYNIIIGYNKNIHALFTLWAGRAHGQSRRLVESESW